MVMIDNKYVPSSSTAILRKDEASSAVPDSKWQAGAEQACRAAMKNCYEEGGRGALRTFL